MNIYLDYRTTRLFGVKSYKAKIMVIIIENIPKSIIFFMIPATHVSVKDRVSYRESYNTINL